MIRLHRTIPVQCLLLGTLTACTGDSGEQARATPIQPSPEAAGRRAASPEMRSRTGLSHLPAPTDERALAASLKRHYPASLREQRVAGSALVDVHVSSSGRVEAVDVVPRPSAADHPTHRAVLRDPDGTTVLELADRPEFGAAAQAALRETRFQPALKDGKPVPYTVRMTVEFNPSSRPEA